MVFGIWKLSEFDWLTRITTHFGPQPKDFFRAKLKGQPWTIVSQSLHDAYNSPLQQARLLHELESMHQHQDELFAAYVERARALARRIDINMQERELRSHIKKGIRQPEFQKEFIKGSLKPLEVLCEEISILEAVEFEASTLQPGNRKPIFQITTSEPSDGRPSKPPFLPGVACSYCKHEGHHRTECNKLKYCTTCGGRFHLAPECKTQATLNHSDAVTQEFGSQWTPTSNPSSHSSTRSTESY